MYIEIYTYKPYGIIDDLSSRPLRFTLYTHEQISLLNTIRIPHAPKKQTSRLMQSLKPKETATSQVAHRDGSRNCRLFIASKLIASIRGLPWCFAMPTTQPSFVAIKFSGRPESAHRGVHVAVEKSSRHSKNMHQTICRVLLMASCKIQVPEN